ncbi:DNA methyltransferase [Enterobacter kobei]|uniref:DNA methyltransferase n=1 Tax=Enterobacter kobei TaxID=208224 RepID=UPI0039C98425
MQQDSLFSNENSLQEQKVGQVTCLGKTFDNDQARREYFLALLAEKLKDPEFRKIEGFPIGSDENILNLSDPPFYTACPNPWIEDIVAEWESKNLFREEKYHREPFVADVSEGKQEPIYNAHSYHTKVPHKAIMRYFLHYTEPGDIVLDGFSGSGMAGVAAQMCASQEEIRKLGYIVDTQDGSVSSDGVVFSHVGARKCILNDLSPSANNIAFGSNSPIDVTRLQKIADSILSSVKEKYSWMFKTIDPETGNTVDVKYYVWSEVLQCSSCSNDVVFSDNALSEDYSKVSDNFQCKHCGVTLNKKDLIPVYEKYIDQYSKKMLERPKRVMTLVCFSRKRRNIIKRPDEHDLNIINEVMKLSDNIYFPSNEIPDMQMMRVGRMKPSKISQINHFYYDKIRIILSHLWQEANSIDDFGIREALCYWLDSHFVNLSLRNRFRPGVSFPYNPMAGVFYVPMMSSEANPFIAYENKLERILTAFNSIEKCKDNFVISCGSASNLKIRDNTIDYIFTDPPFGENIYYSDLNFFIEAWRGVFTNVEKEAIIDRVKGKDLITYINIMCDSFKEYFRVLKPGKWITVEFSNTQSSVWNGIQTALSNAGFIVAGVSILDKITNTFQAVNTTTAVKQDLVISAYKPNSDFEQRFKADLNTPDGVWDFIFTHLNYLPVTKQQNGALVYISERDPRILYDQLVAYYVRSGHPVPMSSIEFQTSIEQRLVIQDGMVFLPEQSVEYARKKILAKELIQASLFVKDEATAISWLTQLLKRKPSVFSDVNPLFMQQLGGWSKNEIVLDLRELLTQNFLCYDGQDEVPDQIHSYLSSNWKELRNLPKNDPALVAKAKDRWYLPDPNKASDLERLREKSLLKEFEEYRATKKKLKVFRIEAVRAGFKMLWERQEHPALIAVADKLPSSILEEDPVLLMYFDQAVTLSQVDTDDEW